MNQSFLLIGGNIGDRERNLDIARDLLEKYCGRVIKHSSIYETAAWGKTDQPAFLNQALEIETDLDAKQLLKKDLEIEELMGRKRKEKYGPRIIDIDILLFNNEKHNDPELKIPHPELQNRRFALLPLNEIASEAVHPVLKKTIRQLLKDCPDTLEVKKT